MHAHISLFKEQTVENVNEIKFGGYVVVYPTDIISR